jgi:hypothetical protein
MEKGKAEHLYSRIVPDTNIAKGNDILLALFALANTARWNPLSDTQRLMNSLDVSQSTIVAPQQTAKASKTTIYRSSKSGSSSASRSRRNTRCNQPTLINDKKYNMPHSKPDTNNEVTCSPALLLSIMPYKI